MPHNCTDLYLHYVQLFHNGLVAVLLRSCHVKNAVSFNSVKHAGLEKCHPRTSVFLCNDESQRSINAFDFLYFISYKGKIIIVSDRSLTQVNTTAHNIIHDAIQKYNISVSIHFKSTCTYLLSLIFILVGYYTIPWLFQDIIFHISALKRWSMTRHVGEWQNLTCSNE